MGCVSSREFREPVTLLMDSTLSFLDRVPSRFSPDRDVSKKDIRFAQGNYKFQSVLGKGGFGLVVSVKERHTDNMFALKIEKFWKSSARQEQDYYQLLQGVPGIPQCYGHWDESGCTLLRMELLGINLVQLSRTLKRSINSSEMSDLAHQMIDLLKNVHEKGLVHCDIKPSNFAFGIGKNENKLHLIDFGIMETFLDSKGCHIEDDRIRKPKGTAPYMGIYQHAGRYNTRRDDMEAIAYTLLDLCLVPFPWRNFYIHGNYNHDSGYEAKVLFVPPIKPLRRMIEMCHLMMFDEEPDYSGMKKLFKNKTNVKWDLKPKDSSPRREVRLNEDDMKILEKFNFDNLSNILEDENFL